MLSLQDQVSLHLCIISFSPWSDLNVIVAMLYSYPPSTVDNLCIGSTTLLSCVAQDRAHVAHGVNSSKALKKRRYIENTLYDAVGKAHV